MKEILRAGCELLADNRDLIRKGFAWDMELMSVAGSVIYTGAGKTVDIEKLKECKKILKKHESVFSEFRSNMEVSVLCKMALQEDPEKYLLDLMSVHEKLRKGKIFSSEYMALTALAICDENGACNIDYYIDMAKILLKRMSDVHPFLTSDEDMAFAALLVLTGKSNDTIMEETEICYDIMKKRFPYHQNAVQSLSHVLTLCEGDPREKCEKVYEIYNALLKKGIKYGKDYELASLGALVSIDMTPEELASEIAEADEYLKTRKGFGDWGMGSKSRAMFAALMAVQAFAPDSVAMDATVLNTSLAIVIAEEISIMIIMASAASSN